MTEPLRRIAEAVADAAEDDVAAVLGSLGAVEPRQTIREAPRKPLPVAGAHADIQSGVDRVQLLAWDPGRHGGRVGWSGHQELSGTDPGR